MAFEQIDECERHWKQHLPNALTFKQLFHVLALRACNRWGRHAKLRKWKEVKDDVSLRRAPPCVMQALGEDIGV
jgi:hypothetical protein